MKYQIGIIYRQFNRKLKGSLIKDKIRRLLKMINLYPIVNRFLLKFFRYTLPIPNKKLEFFSKFIKEGYLCYDIGAWEGEFTELFLRLGARVIAVEPQLECVKKLQINFGKDNRVKIIGKAAGEKIGNAKMYLCKNYTTISTLSTRWMNESRYARRFEQSEIKIQPVSIITLDSLISLFGVPKFCKIDVEGFEESVLKGLTQPIPFISFEFTIELIDIVEKICKHLSTIGKVLFNCVLHGSEMKFLFQKWVTAEELYHKLNSYKNELLCGDIYVKFIKNKDF